MVVNIFDALEEALVERYFVLKVGKQGHGLLLRLFYLRCLVGTDQREEDARHAVEQQSALLVGQNGVGERRLRLVGHDARYLLPLLAYAFLEGRQIVFSFDFAEVRCTVRQRARAHQRIVFHQISFLVLSRCSCARHHGSSQCGGEQRLSEFDVHSFCLLLMILFFCKDSASEGNESLFSNCRTPPILCKYKQNTAHIPILEVSLSLEASKSL